MATDQDDSPAVSGTTAAASPESPAAAPSPPGRRRIWAFRLAAIALSLLPLGLFEAVCMWVDWGRPALHDDPFVGFRAVHPLFVPTEDGTRREIPRARRSYFCRDSFAVPKPQGEFRAFALGGSTVQGNPFAIETAFPRWLELSLTAADPSHPWRLVNCGGVSYASYRLLPILEEVLEYEPDLIILYTGQNEFLEARTFDHVAHAPVVDAALQSASRLRTFTLLREGYLRLQGKSSSRPAAGRPILPEEVEALLDFQGGLEQYHRDDAWRRGVIEQYEFNLRRMIGLCRRRGVSVILMNPVCKLRDCPPFKSEHDAGLSPEQFAKWNELIAAGHRHLRREHYDLTQATTNFERACKLDPLHAGGFYNLAQCYDLLEQTEQARAAYLQAKELDVCPLRILEPMQQIVLSLADELDVPLIDADRLFRERSAGGIVDGRWLVDHVHPSIDGHQLLANELAELLVQQGIAKPGSDWLQHRQVSYRAHFDSLDAPYFQRGMRHLRSLNDWAAGRAERLRDTLP